jgi:chemotaxis protein methyltransferase CheR
MTISTRVSIGEEVFRQMRDFIYEKSGIFIPDNKKYFLEDRLGRRIRELNLKGYEDYFYSLRYNSCHGELHRLFDLITTNETFFFREPQQFDLFRGELSNRIIDENAKAGRRDIRIWSAASSTGDEAYTISIILIENAGLNGFKKDIYASDISESVLASARAGIYSSYAVRNVPEHYMNKYFKSIDQQYNLSSSVKSMVKFSRINLVEEKDVRTMRGIDVIFCRNVLIYFDDKAKQKVVSHLYDSLRPGGYLFIGTSESLHNVTRAFRPVVINKVIVYQKV